MTGHPSRAIPLVGGDVSIRGAAFLEPTPDGIRPVRLPPTVTGMIPDDWMARCVAQPSGVRLCFRTDSRTLELDVRVHRSRPVAMPGDAAPETPPGLFDLIVDGELMEQRAARESGSHSLDLDTLRGVVDDAPLATVRFSRLPGRHAEIELWLPYGEIVTLVAFRGDGQVGPSATRGAVWVHHGSSISHGSGATSGSTTWPALAARSLGWDLVNLGFAGNAVVDPFVARAIRDMPADIISVKLGINVVNRDCMDRRVFVPAVEGFLSTVRDGHLSTPLIVVSPILCPIVEEQAGPTERMPGTTENAGKYRSIAASDALSRGRLSVGRIRDELAAIVQRRQSEGDPAIAYLDGRRLYGEADWKEDPLPDNLHPSAAAHRRMGEAFADQLRELSAVPHAGRNTRRAPLKDSIGWL